MDFVHSKEIDLADKAAKNTLNDDCLEWVVGYEYIPLEFRRKIALYLLNRV